MGLKRVNCLYRTAAMVLSFFSDDVIRQQMGKYNLNNDTIVMIGDVDEMMEKINKAKSLISSPIGFIASLVSSDIKELKEFYEANIPFKFHPNVGNLRSVLKDTEIETLKLNDDLKFRQKYLKYKQKYLKYKQKYINLKNNM